MNTTDSSISRRAVLAGTAATVTLALGVPSRAGAQAAASAPPLGAQESVQDGLKRLFGTRPIKDGAGVVKLEIPLIAENGAVVPITVDVTSPMTPANYVKHVYVVADKNRIPIITRVSLAPESGQASVSTSVRLGETGDVRAIVEQSDGTLVQVKREVKVTVGGCGG
jgi:sulfur-oxidizing protein SoxY